MTNNNAGKNCFLAVSGHEVEVNSSSVQSMASDSEEIVCLKQQFENCKLENKKLTDQLNCLLSLIKRSWTGDRIATKHLSNIIGLSPVQLENENIGSIARANSNDVTYLKKKKCEQNWERLAYKLLEREYLVTQKELHHHQQNYLENRQMYMDAVLTDHHSSMSKLSLHHKNEKTMLGRTRGLRRTQSAGQRQLKTMHEMVENKDVSLRDLVGDINFKDQPQFSQIPGEPYTITPSKFLNKRPKSSSQLRRPPPKNYTDATRYTQKNLFELKENDVVQKPRPVSASSLLLGDIQRSRPRMNRGNSAETPKDDKVFITQKNERPLKYETTRPVSVKPKSGKQPRNVNSEAAVTSNENGTSFMQTSPLKVTSQESKNDDNFNNVCDDYPHNIKNYPSLSDLNEVDSKPPKAPRIKSSISQRPKYIDEFTKDEQKMKEIEDEFKKNAMMLQKKLGLCESGFINLN